MRKVRRDSCPEKKSWRRIAERRTEQKKNAYAELVGPLAHTSRGVDGPLMSCSRKMLATKKKDKKTAPEIHGPPTHTCRGVCDPPELSAGIP